MAVADAMAAAGLEAVEKVAAKAAAERVMAAEQAAVARVAAVVTEEDSWRSML